jgi:hypothetical protein
MRQALFVLAIVLVRSVVVSAETVDVDLGGLVLVISRSETAQVFHIVDQLSEWDQFAHEQYGRWAAKSLSLNQADRDLLRKHAELRRARGWGHGFERAFYVDDPVDVAARHAIATNLLTAAEAETEKTILLHFAPKLTPLLETSAGQISAFTHRLNAESSNLKPLVEKLCRFAKEKETVRVPGFLVPNPEEGSGGGGSNGGRVVVEIQQQPDTLPFLIHEAFHALLDPHRAEITSAAESVGLTWQRLSEGIAYALAPGLTDKGESDPLAEAWTRKTLSGATSSDTFVQFYMVATVIRPLLRAALDRGDTLTEFLPEAVAKWRRIAPP